MRLTLALPKILAPVLAALLGVAVFTIGLSITAFEQRKTLLAASAENKVSTNRTLPSLMHFRSQVRVREALALKLKLETNPQQLWLRALHVDGEVLAIVPRHDSTGGTTAFTRTSANRLKVLTAVELFAHNTAAHYRGTLAAIPFMDAQFKISMPVFSPIDPLRTDVSQTAYQQALSRAADRPRRFVAGYIEQGIFVGDILETMIPTLGQALIISIFTSLTVLLTFWFFAHRTGVKAAQLEDQARQFDQQGLSQYTGVTSAPPTYKYGRPYPQVKPSELMESATLAKYDPSTSTDPVTNLPCRQQLREHMAMLLRAAASEHSCVGLVLIEVCSIAPIFKAKGREVSNSVLKEMTARILNSIRRSDMASRGYDAGGEAMLDADQFCIVLQGIDDLQGLARVAQRLMDLLRQPVTVAGETFSLSVVASAAAAPQHGVTPEGLLTAVKSALLEARESEAPNAILFNS